MSQRAWGIFLIVVAFGILGFIAYKNSMRRQVPIIFSPRNELLAIWEQYKQDYLEPNTFRVLDRQKENITTSEGQSYAMLRAVWLDDKTTFDKVWQWTKDNLQRDDNKLFSWLFGKRSDGSYGILTEQGGYNTASDADVDIALALIFASARWNEATYLGDAQVIIDAMWEHEILYIENRPYLAANNIEKNAPNDAVINPSYLSPYAFRIFATLDERPWLDVVDTSYEVIAQSLDSTLEKNTSASIPPDWVFVNRKTGSVSPPKGNNLTSRTSFDALRVPWRLYLDWEWYKEPRARNVLEKMSFFSDEWRDKSLLYTSYEHDGTPAVRNQSAAFYGGTLGYFMAVDPDAAKMIYEHKLQVLFNPDSNTWKVPLGYYDDNWAWFGIALYNKMLPNLAAQ